MDDGSLSPTVSLPGGLASAATTFAGRYRILAALGAGGMGAVYRAHDLELEEEVALKVLRPGLWEDPDALARFRREVKLARRVTHVNVARTYHLGTHDGALFLTMELVAGEPLSRRIARGPLSLAEALRVGGEIARGLTAAHAVEVVHRDLKPENVIVSEDRVVITDFGIARSADVEGDARTTGGVIGTPAYMAPEQVEARALDGRADVYALGVVLFEALTGRLPFEAPTPLGMAAMRLTSDPPDPRAHVPRLPGPIAELVLDMLARKREHRPAAQTVLSRIDALRGAAPPPVSGVPMPAIDHASTTVRIAELTGGDETEASLANELARALHECVQSIERAKLVRGDAELVLAGSVRARKGRLRVRLRLVDREGADAWVGSADGTLDDELELEDRVMQVVRGALRAHAERAPIATPARRTHERLDPEVRDLLERGRARMQAYLDPTALDEALELLERAAERAPDDAAVQGTLAFALARRWVTADTRQIPVDMGRAEELCYRAIASDPTHPEALQALGMLRYVTGDMRGAARALREALSRAPDLLEANVYLARLLEESGNAELAGERWALVSRLAPARFEPSLSRMREAAFAGDMAAVDREAAWARQHGGLVNELLARSRFAMWWRDRARARECLELAEQIESHVIRDNVTPLLRMVLGERGLDDAWIRARFRAHVASRRMLSFREQMSYEILAWQGEIDAALDHLERSAVLPLIDVAWMDRCPVLAPLRALPRFAAARAVVTARIDDMWS